MVDTGSTNYLISVETVNKMKKLEVGPMRIDMKVAGNTLKNNIMGKSKLVVQLATIEKEKLAVELEFLTSCYFNTFVIFCLIVWLVNLDCSFAVLIFLIC